MKNLIFLLMCSTFIIACNGGKINSNTTITTDSIDTISIDTTLIDTISL